MIKKALIWAIKLPVHVYRYTISPLIASNCRFQPTCSSYALEALDQHGIIRGLVLIVKRFSKCRPGGGSGYDPVPPKSVAMPHPRPKNLDD